jgi:hypothetical protein
MAQVLPARRLCWILLHTLSPRLPCERIHGKPYLTANSDRLSHFGHRMSLFLQTLALAAYSSLRQEHRYERIGLRMYWR